MLAGPAQGSFDPGIEAAAPRARLVPPAASPALSDAERPGPALPAAAPRVVPTDSRVLFEALNGVFAGLGFGALGDEVFRDLVLARVVEPASVPGTGRVLADLGRKERRVGPQVVVGLLADRYGFPLEIGCFEGNQAEKLTILPVIRQFQARHGLEAMVVVADAGMLSAANLADLDEAGLGFIAGSRVTRAPADLEPHFRWHGDAFTDGQVTGTLTPKAGKNKDNDPAPRAEPARGREDHPQSWRAVWAFSAKRLARDNRTLTARENRARDVINGSKPARTPRFARNAGGTPALDEKALARARKLAGLKGYVTSLAASVMPPAEVISCYHDLWHVEQSFRMSKTDLAARPMFVRKRDAIEAHLTIVLTALAVAREIHDRTGPAIRNVIRQLRPLRSATIAINGAVQTFPPATGPEQQKILDDLRH
jgi:hypothetical protein